MSSVEKARPTGEVAMKPPSAARTDREIVAELMDGSIVMGEDFPKAMADLALSDLGIVPSQAITIHDVRRAAEAGARTAIRVARALVGPPDDLEELERRIANNGNGEG